MTDNLANTAANGDMLATLELLRNRLAQEIDQCDDQRDLTGLTHQFRQVLAEIDNLPQTKAVSKADEIAARRTARRGADSAHPARATKRSG